MISKAPDTDTASEFTNSPEEWEEIVVSLRERFAKASDGILFCVHKLQHDSDLRLVDFREEANLHGIKLGGRALHSARVLLGLAEPETANADSELCVAN